MESFFEQPIFQETFLKIALGHWLKFAIILFITFIIVKLVSVLFNRLIQPFVKKTRNKLDDTLYTALRSPILFGLSLLGIWIAIHFLEPTDKMLSVIGKSYKILVTLNATWFFARLVIGLLEEFWVSRNDTKNKAQVMQLMPLIHRALLIIVWAIGIAMALGNVGVDVTALLGTLGIGSIAFALAAQDTVKNIFGGVTLFTDKPFVIGDTVNIDGNEGTIVDIGIRSTRMRNYDKRLITFPNYKIIDTAIVNISKEPARRVVLKLGLTYDTTPQKMESAMQILRDMPQQVQYLDKNVTVAFSEFADSALILTFTYFITKGGDITAVNSNVNMEILKSFNREGLSFAFPSQTVYMCPDNQAKAEATTTGAAKSS